MKYWHLLFLAAILCSCATPSRTIICFAPTGSFEPETGEELFEAFNDIVPFDVSPKRFACKAKSKGRLVGWVVVSTETQKDAAKAALRESPDIQGIPCKGGLLAPVYFHDNGKLKKCTLARDITLNGVEYPKGQTLTLSKDGSVLSNT